MTHIAILSINLIDEKIIIYFEKNWFQEDIIELRQLLLDKIPNHQIKEIIQGADRENIRFLWLNAHDEISTSKIQPLFSLISKSTYSHA